MAEVFAEVDPYDAEWHYRDTPRDGEEYIQIKVLVEGAKSDLKDHIQHALFPIRERIFGTILGVKRHLRCCPWSASLMHGILKHQLPESKVQIGLGIPTARPDIPFHFWTEVDDTIFVDPLHSFNRGRRHPDSANIVIGDVADLSGHFTVFDLRKELHLQSDRFWSHDEKTKQLVQSPESTPIDWPQYECYESEIRFIKKMIQELCTTNGVSH